MMATTTYDFAVIGGGLFGCYAALFLAGKGKSVLLVEKETELLQKASIVNQARLHAGYHYPRSVATALMSNDHKARFSRDHHSFINDQFDQYYGIDRNGSLTDRIQFERFCDYMGLPYKPVKTHPLFNFDQLEALYLTREQSFDPVLIARYYRQRIKDTPTIDLRLEHTVTYAESGPDRWELILTHHADNNNYPIRAIQVINATYAASNAIHQLFGLAPIELMHELSEIVLLTAPKLRQIGLTVMDGPFASLMPYGHSGLLSLSSVAYTHHKVSYRDLPEYDCQSLRSDCRPDFIADCTDCPFQPASNYQKMIRQIAAYFRENISLDYVKSLFTVKSKLKANYIDDGRPTEIAIMQENPRFYCIFAGKINSIYEIEKIVDLG